MGFWSRLNRALIAASEPPPTQQVPMDYPWPVDINGNISPLGRLQCRLRVGVFSPNGHRDPYSERIPPYDHLDAVETKDDVVVFVLKNGKPAVIHDDKGLFPSDTLITQLKLIEGQ